jgi:hypothetical protein
MSGRLFLTLPLILTILLASCEDRNQAPVAAVASVLGEKTPEARKGAVIRAVKAICATPLTDDELEWVAQFVEENRSAGAVYVAGRLWKMNDETLHCRGAK